VEEGVTWKIDDPQGNEAAKVRFDIVPFTRGVVLDLGCGPFKAFPHFIGVDNGHHEAFGWEIKPEVTVETCERLEGTMTVALAKRFGILPADDDRRGNVVLGPHRIPDASCDAVFSSHLLEHIEDTEAALTEWWRVVKPGGHLVLYLPHRHFYPNVGEEGANPDHKHDFMPAEVTAFMVALADGFDLVVSEERNEGFEYSFLQVYRKRADGVQDVALWEVLERERKAQKRCCIVRYGGIGDMVMMSSVLPQLKEQGYHITVMTTLAGREVVSADPHIDEFIIQDTDQVPNPWLGEHWRCWAKKFDRFINFSEVVEASLLPLPGTSRHSWPESMRQKYLNENYLEFHHQIAELEYQPRPRFFATPEEIERVKKWRAALGDALVVLWTLAGSSPHKTYPHTDAVVARLLMHHPRVVVAFVGDVACQILEAQWEAEQRVIRLSGKIGVRETLALACHGVDCVVGPETGVLNAVSHTKIPKVVMLSHSSIKNLTRNWASTTNLVASPTDAPCYPCHRLHTDRTYCPDKIIPIKELTEEMAVMDEFERKLFDQHTDKDGFHTGAALCAYGIPPDRVVRAVLHSLPSRSHLLVPA
jgi:ADP-heptose:LPS heptosyltransferase/SAM-dependent methyltransferase